jgi:hypothetical protein
VTSTSKQGLDPQAAGAAFTERVWQEGAAPPRASQLQLNLTNVSGLTIDLAGAGFGPGEAGTANVASDGPTRLVLKGLSPAMAVSIDGGSPAAADGGAVAVAVAAGTHQVTFGPLPSTPAAGAAGASVRGAQLAATGVPETALAVVGLVLLVGALSLRRVLARAYLFKR